LGATSILRDSMKSGMHSYFDNIMDGFCDAVSDFNCNSFTSKDMVRPKAQHGLASVLF